MEAMDSNDNENHHKKLKKVPSIVISEETNSKYRENLLKEVDVAFERKRKTSTSSVSSSGSRSSNVLSAVRAYEAKVNQLFQPNDSSICPSPARFSKVYKEWTEVARNPPTTPRTLARNFAKKRWLTNEQNHLKSERFAEEVNSLDGKTKKKLQSIAKELLSTEETYVEILYILDQIFFKQILEVSQQKSIPESVAKSIFQNLSAIYMFHSTYLLPQLRKRIEEWHQNPRIGDIMIEAAPFLKMYALYIDNHNKAIEAIQEWKEKSKEFANLIQKLEGKEECKNLTLESHMLTPVQRTPRYKLLLESYLSHLPEKSSQRKEVEEALEIVGIAANHSNNYIKSKEKSLRLVEVYKQLSIVDFDTQNLTRKLLKQGEVVKIAARNGKKHDRYLYLFDDVLLCCKDCNPIHKVQGKVHQVAVNHDLTGVRAYDGKDASMPTFFVQGIEKQNEFLCNSSEERDSWVTAINNAVSERVDNQNSFLRQRSNSINSVNLDPNLAGSPFLRRSNNGSLLEVPSIESRFLTDNELGKRAPHWVSDKEVTMCMQCSEDFHIIMRRRHHCRACGRAVCSSCSKKSLPLFYRPEVPQRVCDACFLILNPNTSSNLENKEAKIHHPNIGEPLLFGHLYYEEKAESWTEMWCVIPASSPQTCLCYKAKMDLRPLFLVGFAGSDVTSANTEKYSHSFCITDVCKKKFVFASDNSDVIEKWIDAIEKASSGNPTNTIDLSK